MKLQFKRGFTKLLAISAGLSLSLVTARATITVACVGDSITAGYGLTNASTQSYPAQLQALLGGTYTVNNYGYSGATALKSSDNSYWNTGTFQSSTNSGANIVVIMFGANDSKSWNWNAINFTNDYLSMIRVYQSMSSHPKVYVCYTTPMFLPTAFGTTFDPVFIENTVEPAIGSVAAMATVSLIDNQTPLLNHPEWFQDGVHPLPYGAGLVAQQVANAIKGIAPTNITTAAITSSLNPSVQDAPVTYTATISSPAGTPPGNVVFTLGNTPFSTNILSGGTASVIYTNTPLGSGNIVHAQYLGQGNYIGSTHSLYQNVVTSAGVILTDIGSAPTTGTNDIAQLSTQGNTTWPDGINYFSNNNPPVGQIFTTGTNVLSLASVAIKTAGLNNDGNRYGNPSLAPTYYLRIYSISGSTATLLETVSASNPGFTDGDWLKWTGLNVLLGTNKTYAFTFGIPNDASWVALAVATNKYTGGEIVTIPITGGAVVMGGSHSFDAVFDLGFQAGPTNIPASTPWPMPTCGMNVGNELELSWGAPNAALFYSAVQNGFNAVRIPCAWNHNSTTNISGGVTNYLINASYMTQVKQTVDNAVAAGMYVMINDHWDDGWLENDISTNFDPIINAKMKAYWTQIATTFAGYDNHLLFAAANEPNVTSPDMMKMLVYYYQTFVNTIRGVGANNTNRWLVLQSVSDPTWMNALPTDTVSNRLMVEYHNYTPSLFTLIHSDQSWGSSIYFWGLAYHYSGDSTRNATWGEEGSQDSFYQELDDLYVSKGIPVMIGEFGAYGSSLTNATEATWNADSTYYWDKYVAESARVHGISPFYWSTGSNPFDYTTGANYNSQSVAALTGGAAPPPPNGAPYAASGLTATLINNTNVSLSWTAGSGATSYNLYRAAESGYEGTNPVVTGIAGRSYTDTNLNSGTTYYYLVAAVNSSGLAGFSPEAHATTSGFNLDPAQYNFETDPQDWTGGGGIISGVATSAVTNYNGKQSLAVNFNGSSSGSSTVFIQDISVAPGQTITFHVWIPSGSKISGMQPYMVDYNWNTTWGNSSSLTANAWNTFTLTVPQTATVPFQYLAIEFWTSAAWTGTCYVDSISWNSSGPDFNLAASPTSLTVNAGTNGTSTVTVTAIKGLNACYTLSAPNLPAGVSASFTNNPSVGGASILMITASNNVVSGTTNVTVVAIAGLISHTTTIALTVTGQTNTPPVLAAITNRTVNVGQTVTFTASATDTNQPPPTLTFVLLGGATNATLSQINNTNTSFSFRPLVTQASSTNNFTLKVSDNGAPSLSATQNFAIVVNPLSAPSISAISAVGGHFGFNVSGQNGPDYAVETSTNLMQWNNVFITNSPTLPFVWTDTNSALAQRFYRVKLGPPLP